MDLAKTKVIGEYLNKLAGDVESGNITIADIPYNKIYEIVLDAITSCNDGISNPAKSELLKAYFAVLMSSMETGGIRNMAGIIRLMSVEILNLTEIETGWMDCYERLSDNTDKLAGILFNSSKEYNLNQYRNRIAASRESQLAVTVKKGRGVIYTAITGGYDDIKEPYKIPGVDYICFTDNKSLKSDDWEIRYLLEDENDSIRKARKCKILPHLYLDGYDYAIWVDAKMSIDKDILELIRLFSVESALLCFPHYQNDCVYQEAEACIALGKGVREEIDRQIARYRKEKYPEHNGMIDSAVLFRLINDTELIKMEECWWNEISNESYRDQLSFNYSCWKNNFRYDLCNMPIYRNEYFSVHYHNK